MISFNMIGITECHEIEPSVTFILVFFPQNSFLWIFPFIYLVEISKMIDECFSVSENLHTLWKKIIVTRIFVHINCSKYLKITQILVFILQNICKNSQKSKNSENSEKSLRKSGTEKHLLITFHSCFSQEEH